MTLTGKRIVITGANGALGRGVSRCAQALGAQIVLLDLDFAADLRAGEAQLMRVDLGDDAATQACFAQIGTVDVPTSGLYVPDSPGTCPAHDVRPFGLKYYLGKVYVSVVCSGESRPESGDVASGLLSDGAYKNGTSTFTDGNGDSRFTWQDDQNLHAYVLRMDAATLAFELARSLP